jgi:superfamily I DNA/RNA helicase
MRAYNAVDFDDLLLRAMSALENAAVRARWSERYDYLLVDEYQDTSPDQLELLQVLAARHGNVCVVGDDDQAIYAWRGAAVDNILSFGKQFPRTHEIILDQNYRSTSNILASANAVIKNNALRKEKVLWSALGDGEPVEIVACGDAEDEAELVVETIGKLVYEGAKHHDIAILYRANAQSQVFEETLALEKIPFRVVGGQEFFDRKEVRDAVAFLQVAQNPYDEIALRRIINVPPRGIGATSVERLVQHGESTGKGLWYAMAHGGARIDLPGQARAGLQQFVDTFGTLATQLKHAKRGELSQATNKLFEAIGLRQSIVDANETPNITAKRLENLDHVVRALERFESHTESNGPLLVEFLRVSALTRGDTEVDDEDEKKGKVTLMTLHSAKGLEFPYVFLVGMEEDLLPHKRTIELGLDFGEERRLCYVGMTRARRRLWLTYAKLRMKYGRAEPRTPSRFLMELPGEPAVLTRERHIAPQSEEEADALADDFFKKMKAQLGIDG